MSSKEVLPSYKLEGALRDRGFSSCLTSRFRRTCSMLARTSDGLEYSEHWTNSSLESSKSDLINRAGLERGNHTRESKLGNESVTKDRSGRGLGRGRTFSGTILG